MLAPFYEGILREKNASDFRMSSIFENVPKKF